MPYKDPAKQREYLRNYQRRRRSGRKGGFTGLSQTQLATFEDLRTVFERITSEVLDAEDLDLGVKGRVLAQLLAVGIKLFEGTDIEHRILALEERAEMSKYA